MAKKSDCHFLNEMSVFESVVATLKTEVSRDIEERILEVCTEIDENLVLLKDHTHSVSVQGCLASIVNLDGKLREIARKPTESSETLKIEELEYAPTDRESRLPYLHCSFCSFKTKRANHLSKHLALHSKIQTIVSCDRCDFKCLRQADLAKHVRKLHQSSKKEEQGELYQQTTVQRCNQCFYEAKSVKVLENHKSTKHSSSANGQIFECQKCPYKTPKAIRMNRHSVRHSVKHSVARKLYRCDFLHCGYKTVKASNFTRHQLTHDNNDRKHLCIICGLTFKRSDTLKQHLSVHGEGHVCEICNRICRSLSHLNDHKATHSSDKNFLCQHCGQKFKTKAAQVRHIRCHHNLKENRINDINDLKLEEEEDEPVIYTLDLTQDPHHAIDNNLQYLINESGSLIINSNHDLS